MALEHCWSKCIIPDYICKNIVYSTISFHNWHVVHSFTDVLRIDWLVVWYFTKYWEYLSQVTEALYENYYMKTI